MIILNIKKRSSLTIKKNYLIFLYCFFTLSSFATEKHESFPDENNATISDILRCEEFLEKIIKVLPPGKGSFLVFHTQWNHRKWAQVAVRRRYIGCVYAGADAKDDTETYSEIWAGEYDFTRLMRRAYGASRAIYLYTFPFVDKGKIGITGHPRNGKQSLMAAAFDERITACIPSSGVTGAEVPWRYCTLKYDIENVALLSAYD